MKALFVALGVYSRVGGLERFNQRVVRGLGELGAQHGLESWALALWDGYDARAVAPASVKYLPGNSNKLRTALQFSREVLLRKPEVILYGHILLAPLAAVARLLSPRSRNVLFVHGREVWLEPFRSRVPAVERLLVRGAIDEVAAVSRLTAGRMAAAYGLAESKFRILPNAVDAPVSAPIARNGAGGAPALVTVTRLNKRDNYKGCDKVIRALPRILAEVPTARYDVVGEGNLRPELERLAEEAGVRHAIRFLGYVDDRQLEHIYDNASLLVMPSTGEGFGIVFLEAWKHGLPVVAGNRDASAEVVTDGVTGLCVDPESVPAIAEAVIGLLKNPTEAARMGQRGYRTMLERYTHDNFRHNLWQIIQS